MQNEVKTKDNKIQELQREVYGLKLEKIEEMKKDLQKQLDKIAWSINSKLKSWPSVILKLNFFKCFVKVLLKYLEYIKKYSNNSVLFLCVNYLSLLFKDQASFQLELSVSTRKVLFLLATSHSEFEDCWLDHFAREYPVSIAQFLSRCFWKEILLF